MDGLKKKILLDCFVTPFTMVPILFGGTLLLLTEFVGPIGDFIGFTSCLVGIGAMATNMIFNLEKITDRATQKWQEGQQKQRERELDTLDHKLAATPWTDDETALRNLRALYSSFCRDFGAGKISSNVPVSLLGQIDDIFNTCVVQLAKSYEVYLQSEEVQGILKKQFLAQRKQMVQDVETSVEQLAQTINEVRAMKMRASRSELTELQKRLHSQLNVAKAVEERMARLEQGDLPVEERLKEYQT